MSAKKSKSDVDNIPTGPNNKKGLSFETLQLHVGQETPDPVTDSRAVPIYLTTSYVFKNCKQAADRFALKEPGNIYARLGNSTQDVFEKRIAALEGGTAAIATASGAAAITYTFQNVTRAGDHIVSSNNIYGGTYNLLAHTLPDFGVTTTFVDPENLDNFEKAIQPNTKAILVETFGNPNATLIDIDAVAKIAHKHKIILVVDNTFATPYLFRPLEHGADIVVESATKFIGGHGLVLGGVVIEGGHFDWKASGKYPQFTEADSSYHGLVFGDVFGSTAFVTRIRSVLLRDMGAAISPISAFILIESLETLSMRLDKHVENAIQVVDYLANHPKVAHVNHPALKDHPDHALYEKYFPNGAGSIFTFDIKGTSKDAQKFCESLKIFSLLANVADVKSLVIHPASTTHSQLNEKELKEQKINQTTIRLSIGCENIKDILADFDQAFKEI
ncbi:MAG: O-acetylhomoserine aminocarboxypropyltransferase/cysteine synthase [Candidatus Cloacimonetes bacterium]|nr:O-acetylhomoserine aminocarboxypropyltransferase/cysteine synthase [Candidatus Cloacimonadota bacterium]